MEYKDNQLKQLLDFLKKNKEDIGVELATILIYLEKKRDSYDLYSDKWLEYNNKYQTILFNEIKQKR